MNRIDVSILEILCCITCFAFVPLVRCAEAHTPVQTNTQDETWEAAQSVQPQFGPVLKVRALSRVNGIVTADFDKDGFKDIAIIGSDGDKRGQFAVFKNLHGKSFERSGPVVSVGSTASGLDWGDLNGDDQIDLVVSQHDELLIVVLMGGPDGSFEKSEFRPTYEFAENINPHSHNVVVVDLDGDGRLDIVCAQAEANKILVAKGKGDGTFHETMEVVGETGKHPYVLAALDFNQDGRIDLITPNVESKNLTVLESSPDGFNQRTIDTNDRRPSMIAWGDLDGDKKTDLLFNQDEGKEFSVLRQADQFKLKELKVEFTSACLSPKILDLNNDGRDDIVALSMPTSQIIFWMNSEDGLSGKKPAVFSLDKTDPQILQAGDLNNDGVADLVVGSWNSSDLYVVFGKNGKSK